MQTTTMAQFLYLLLFLRAVDFCFVETFDFVGDLTVFVELVGDLTVFVELVGDLTAFEELVGDLTGFEELVEGVDLLVLFGSLLVSIVLVFIGVLLPEAERAGDRALGAIKEMVQHASIQ